MWEDVQVAMHAMKLCLNGAISIPRASHPITGRVQVEFSVKAASVSIVYLRSDWPLQLTASSGPRQIEWNLTTQAS